MAEPVEWRWQHAGNTFPARAGNRARPRASALAHFPFNPLPLPGEAQFWSLGNPFTAPNYPARHGIPPDNVANANFIETATLNPGSSVITRPAPPVGINPGVGIEAVVPSSGAQMK